MIVHHSDSLHERITYGRANETEAAFFQIFAHGIGFGCAGRNVAQALSRIQLRLAPDKSPDVAIEGPEFFLDERNAFAFLIAK